MSGSPFGSSFVVQTEGCGKAYSISFGEDCAQAPKSPPDSQNRAAMAIVVILDGLFRRLRVSIRGTAPHFHWFLGMKLIRKPIRIKLQYDIELSMRRIYVYEGGAQRKKGRPANRSALLNFGGRCRIRTYGPLIKRSRKQFENASPRRADSQGQPGLGADLSRAPFPPLTHISPTFPLSPPRTGGGPNGDQTPDTTAVAATRGGWGGSCRAAKTS